MQTNIFDLIDLLVKMSGSKSNLDELKADLDDTIDLIEKKQKRIANLENEMNDDKYFDASSEIVDRNIEISLSKRIQKHKKIKSGIDKDLDVVASEEKRLHDELEDIREEIDRANDYNNIINSNKSNQDTYLKMIGSENNRISNLISKQDELNDEYEKVQKKLEYLSKASIEMNDKIAFEQERLDDISSTLSNIKAYIDTDAKESDEQKYTSLKEELESLINHKEEILNDPVYISGTIKELIANDEKENIEKEFNRLVDIVKNIPYMELEAKEIEIEKDKLDDELKSFDEEISKKEYHTQDGKYLEDRIDYLEKYIKNIKSSLDKIVSEENSISEDNAYLSEKIFNAEALISSIDSSLIDYENYDYESEKLSKATVQAANNKLLLEKSNIKEIADQYREHLVININNLNEIKNKKEFYENELEKRDKELDALNKKLALNTKSTNILEEEKDKVSLQEINNKILKLKNREKYTKSLSEIVNEFEMLNSSLEFVDKETRTKRYNKEELNEVSDFKPLLTPNEENDEIETVENYSLENVTEDLNEEAKSEEIVLEEENKEEEKPIFDSIIDEPLIIDDTQQEKLRVVEVIPISDGVQEKEEEQNFMVNDFQDDDYMDLNTAFSSVEEN